MSDKLSRRDFIKSAIVGVGGGLLAGTAIGKAVVKILEPPQAEAPHIQEPELSPEQQKLVDEIIEYRKSLGLEGPPSEMGAKLLEKNEWVGEAPIFENLLPEKNVSYGQYTNDALSAVFGTNYTRLVKGCLHKPEAPGLMAFDHYSRFCVLPDGAHDFPIDKEYINFVLHEGIGHGSEPIEEMAKYPKDIFIKVEHGKWRALTQMFNLPGEMLNHPGDQMYPMLKRQVGKTVGKTFIADGNLEKILDGDGRIVIEQKIASLAASKGIDVKDLKFNKAVCKGLSSIIIPSILDGSITVKGDLKNSYSYFLENSVAVEIYAEMVRYAISQPEKMNDTVIEGITEVISAINGKLVSLAEIMQNIEHPSQQIILRNAAEIEALTIVQNVPNELTPVPDTTNPIPPEVSNPQPVPVEADSTNEPILSNQEIATIAEQQAQVEIEKSDEDNFIYDGKLPDTLHFSDSQAAAINKYADLYRNFNNKWPGVVYINISNDDNFDPNMHLWEIEDLDYAVSLPFIRGFLQNTEVSDQVIGEIERKTKILESFNNTSIVLQ